MLHGNRVIKVGERYWWEPGNPIAQELVEVIDIKDVDGERLIKTKLIGGQMARCPSCSQAIPDGWMGRGKNNTAWNDEERFREACLPARSGAAATRAK